MVSRRPPDHITKPIRLEEMDEAGNKGQARSETHPMVRLFRYIRPHRTAFWLGCTYSLLNMVFDLMPPLLTKWMLDSVEGSPPFFFSWFVDDGDKKQLALFIALLTFFVFAVESLTEYLARRTWLQLAQRTQHGLRMDVWASVSRREMAFFENNSHGNTLNHLHEDVSQLERFLNHGFSELLITVCTVIFASAVLLAVSWELGVVASAGMPFIVLFSMHFARVLDPLYTRVREASGSMLARLENSVAGVAVTTAFGAQASEAARVRESSADYRDANVGAILVASLFVPCVRMIIAIGYSGVLYLGTVRAIEGEISLGDLALASMLSQRTLWPLTRVARVLDEAQRATASARRSFRLVDTPSSVRDPDPATPLPPRGGARGRVLELDAVDFGYGQGRAKLFEGLSLRVEAGQFVGVCGETGAGKTTVSKLMLRFVDADAGAVRVDGVDVREVALDELRAQFSLVSQEGYLFSGTVRENIAYGAANEGASLEQVRSAARVAHVDEFIMGLPQQYETLVGERGVRLSGGQRQRLAIARAVLKDAPVILLDEATASIDSATERVVQQNLHKILSGRTSVVIAHRLSTIRHADRIVVLGSGGAGVVEDGTHEELLERRGVYWQLWSTQVGDAPPVEEDEGAEPAEV